MYTVTDISKQMISSPMTWWDAQIARAYLLTRKYCDGIPLLVIAK